MSDFSPIVFNQDGRHACVHEHGLGKISQAIDTINANIK